MDLNDKLKAPIPRRKGIDPLERSASTFESGFPPHQPQSNNPPRSSTPNYKYPTANVRRPLYISLESTREQHYNLDYPEDRSEIEALHLDPELRFFARKTPRTLNLPRLLPYETETPRDQAKFLSHIVLHLYIAIRTLDLQGALSITSRDLASIKAHLLDVDVALETNLFEAAAVSAPELNQHQQNHDQTSEDDDNLFTMDELHDLDMSYDLDSEYESDDDDAPIAGGVDGAQQHKRSPRLAAVVGVRIWTQELLVWMAMKYEMPVLLRIALARVYYAICLLRGQLINMKGYFKAFDTLTRDPYFMRDQGLKLPWEPLLQELEVHLPDPDHDHTQAEQKDRRQLIRLAEKSSLFFESLALPIMFSRLASRFTVSLAGTVMATMSILPPHFSTGIENPLDIRHYISLIFYFWEKAPKLSTFPTERHLVPLLGKIAMTAMIHFANSKAVESCNTNDFTIFSNQQMTFIFTQLLDNLSIQPQKYSSTRASFFHGYASAIVFSMKGDSDDIIQHINTLMNAVGSYVHPLNTGEWLRAISRMTFDLIYQYHKRYNLENQPNGLLENSPFKLTEKANRNFVNAILPLIRTGVQLKGEKTLEHYYCAQRWLADVSPESLLESVLVDLYESLEGVLLTHRVGVALRTMENLSRYFALTPIYRVHVTRLLSLALPGIDSNDLEKSTSTMAVFGAFSNFVPFYDLTKGEGDSSLALQFTQGHLEWLNRKSFGVDEPFEVDPELEIQALKSSTVAFKEIFITLSQKLFILLESFIDPWDSEGSEKTFVELLPKIFFVIVESLSDEIFNVVAKEWFKFVLENTHEEVADIVGEICGCIIKKNPSLFPNFAKELIEKVRESIDEYGAGALRANGTIVPRDKPLSWNLTILNCCVGDAGSKVLEMKQELMDLSFYLMENVKGITLSYICLFFVNQLLITTTKARITECRLISPEYERLFGVDEKCWGGFQFDQSRLDPDNLKFEWFFPGPKEISFAVDVYTGHIQRVLQKIQYIMKSQQEITNELASAVVNRADELYILFLYLGYSVGSISYLLDPCYDDDIPKINDRSSQTIQERLVLLNQLRLVQGGSSGKEEPRIENIHDNIQKIVNCFDDENGMAIDDNINGDIEDTDEDSTNAFQNQSTNGFDSQGVEKPSHGRQLEDPSGRETPLAEVSTRPGSGLDQEELLNPGLTFRESKLYTSNYYFGDSDTRKKNEVYHKIHGIRKLVGKSLHPIFKFLMTYFLDNSQLFKSFLFTMSLWLCNVGKERLIETSHSELNYAYVSAVQLINKVHKPFTRIAIGARLESYHQLRVSLHATSRFLSDSEKVLVEDIVKLCFSPYSSINYVAQNCLIDSMKRLNGSYNVIIRCAFKHLSKALDEKDFERISSGLDLFSTSRIKNKIQNDYLNLQKYVELLNRCFLVDRPEVHDKAVKLRTGVHNSISTPSSVCIIDFDEIDSIKPPDEYIDLEVKVVKLAKEQKRKIYFEKLARLQTSVLNNELQNNHWKLSILNLILLTNLQTEAEIPFNSNIVEALAVKASKDHPSVSRLAMKGIVNIFNSIMALADFNYDINNFFDLNFVSHDFMIVDTQPIEGESYQKLWKAEMSSTTPNYFIDEKVSHGWFFWDKSMKVVRSGMLNSSPLHQNEINTLKVLGQYVTKEWFFDIAQLWVAESDLNQTFQALDVNMTEVIAHLISAGYAPNIKYEDLLTTISDIYESDEKSTHIITCEMITGILRASPNTLPEYALVRDQFLLKFLGNIYENDLSPDNRGVWTIFAWWLPSHIDVRRFPAIMNWLYTDFKVDSDSDAAVKIATRISYIEAYVLTAGSSFPQPDLFTDFAFSNFTNRYQVIRDQAGSLLSVLSVVYYADSVGSSEEFISYCNEDAGRQLFTKGKTHRLYSRIPELFEFIEQSRLQVLDKSPQEILNSNYIYASTAVLQWLSTVLKTSVGIMYEDFADIYIIPFLIKLTNLKDVCQLGNLDPITVIKRVSQIQYHPDILERIVAMLENYAVSNQLNVIQYIIMGEFTETLYFKNIYKLTNDQRLRLISMTDGLLSHKHIEVREAALSTLAGLIHFSPPQMMEELIHDLSVTYIRNLTKTRRKYKKGFANISSADAVLLHGATLGLGLLINAFPYASPPPRWVPGLLTTIANKSAGLPGIIGKTAKNILGKFRKSRQDTWHIDSKVFDETQMQDLEGVLWKSYFI